jgi:hypothetical protein
MQNVDEEDDSNLAAAAPGLQGDTREAASEVSDTKTTKEGGEVNAPAVADSPTESTQMSETSDTTASASVAFDESLIPMFSGGPHTASVVVGTPENTDILQMAASSSSADPMQYSLSMSRRSRRQSTGGDFTIDPTTGMISTLNSIDGTLKNYDLTVTATAGTYSASASVTIALASENPTSTEAPTKTEAETEAPQTETEASPTETEAAVQTEVPAKTNAPADSSTEAPTEPAKEGDTQEVQGNPDANSKNDNKENEATSNTESSSNAETSLVALWVVLAVLAVMVILAVVGRRRQSAAKRSEPEFDRLSMSSLTMPTYGTTWDSGSSDAAVSFGLYSSADYGDYAEVGPEVGPEVPPRTNSTRVTVDGGAFDYALASGTQSESVYCIASPTDEVSQRRTIYSSIDDDGGADDVVMLYSEAFPNDTTYELASGAAWEGHNHKAIPQSRSQAERHRSTPPPMPTPDYESVYDNAAPDQPGCVVGADVDRDNVYGTISQMHHRWSDLAVPTTYDLDLDRVDTTHTARVEEEEASEPGLAIVFEDRMLMDRPSDLVLGLLSDSDDDSDDDEL